VVAVFLDDSSVWRQALVALPKAHLHVHAEAAVSPRWASVHAPGVAVDAGWSFDAFIDGYRALTSQIGQSPGSLAAAVLDAVTFERSLGVRWLELTVDPFLHPNLGPPGVVVDLFARATSAATRRTKLPVGLVLAVDRTCSVSQAHATVALAAHPAVVAVGVANDERQGPLAAFAPALHRSPKPLVPHAGELSGAGEVEFAVHQLAAHRVGHATAASSDFGFLASTGVEACLTSNALLGVCPVADHPLPQWLAAGVPVGLHADDPALMGTDLVSEFLLAQSTFGLSPRQVASLARNAWRFALCPQSVRSSALAAVDRWLARWAPKLTASS